ncbi:GFA family protein [Phaeovulum vinaykumarii]|uniref:GFA family protein n=1 Tax=Phaeovulum vinaykumarii TaxID=407234 RepID=UPI000971059A|nr:GFA family protein [Phaeovulum vinaykumarii]
MTGRCTCGQVHYAMPRPMFTHCCHCSWCQRESGSAFALNAIVETAALRIEGDLESVRLPSASGKGQEVQRCPSCRVALFSHYAGAGRALAFVRVGTLDAPGACPPDVHIFTSTALPWVVIPEGVRRFENYYSTRAEWPADSLERRKMAIAAAS